MSNHNNIFDNKQNHSPNSMIMMMIIIMIISGLLSTMNLWADSVSHVRFHINDVYMISLMTGWMILFMGIVYGPPIYILLGIISVITIIYAIRVQLFVTPDQYINGMIPHHSMAILMSKELLRKGTVKDEQLYELANNIIVQQEKEIELMKSIYNKQ